MKTPFMYSDFQKDISVISGKQHRIISSNFQGVLIVELTKRHCAYYYYYYYYYKG